MRHFKIPTLIGVFLLLFGVGAGVFLIQTTQIFRLGASPEEVPKDVRITNVRENAFTVSWVTDKPTISSLTWGESESLGNTAAGATIEKNIHLIEVTNLSPSTSYFFKIISAGNEYDNSGIAWQVTTGPPLGTNIETRTASGKILTANGQPAAEVLVYISAGGMAPLSAKTTAAGNWLIPLNNARTSNLASYMSLGESSPLLEIFVQAGPQGVATAQVYPSATNPVPDINLGQTFDFRRETQNNVTGIPEAQINLPTTASPSSGFSVGETPATPSAINVTLDSVDQNEVITTTQPEFFGQGPAGTKITITVESEAQSQEITIGSSGNWQWTPPTDLDPGTHQVTITWLDADGILRSLTRSFTVEASQGPAFESTPSATTTTPTPTPTPQPATTSTPTASPRISLPATDAAVPESGVLTPTIALSIMGLGLLATSVIVWKKI